jgi:hypothetical protein
LWLIAESHIGVTLRGDHLGNPGYQPRARGREEADSQYEGPFMQVFALLAYDPCVRRVYQPAALPERDAGSDHCGASPGAALDWLPKIDGDGNDAVWTPGARGAGRTEKDGTAISVEFTISLLHDPDGTLLGPAAIIRDVTARWEEERALKKRLAALEAGTRG